MNTRELVRWLQREREHDNEQDGDSQRLFWLMAVETAIWAASWAAVSGGGFCRRKRGVGQGHK